MRFAYADPPYPGQAKRLYGEHEAYVGEVDHRELVERLMAEFPDGWALSTSAAALHEVLPLCPPPEPSRKNVGRYLQGTGTRVLSWAKPQTVWRPVSIQYGWEPVLLYGGRPRDPSDVLRDWLVCNPRDGNGRRRADRPLSRFGRGRCRVAEILRPTLARGRMNCSSSQAHDPSPSERSCKTGKA